MKLVVFADINAPLTAGLIEGTLRLARGRSDVEVAAFVTTEPGDFRSRRGSGSIDLFRVARRHGVPVLVPPTGDPNDRAFRTMLAEEVKGDVALSLFALRIFRRPLLDTFEQAINFHNGLLPDYKGVMATSFSLYFGEERTGYTFHRMTEEVDGGPILVQDSVPVNDDDLHRVTPRLTSCAVDGLPRLFEMVASRDPGRPQNGSGRYFSLRDLEEMTGIEHPERLSAEELQRRVRSFGLVYITIGGEPRPVTRLEPAGPDRALAFRTADGRTLAPVEVGWRTRFRRLLSDVRA